MKNSKVDNPHPLARRRRWWLVILALAMVAGWYAIWPRSLWGGLYLLLTPVARAMIPCYSDFSVVTEPRRLLISATGEFPLRMVDGSMLPLVQRTWDKQGPEGLLIFIVALATFVFIAPSRGRLGAGVLLLIAGILLLCAVDLTLQIQTEAFSTTNLQRLPLDRMSGDDANMATFENLIRHGRMAQYGKDFMDAGGRLLLAAVAGLVGAITARPSDRVRERLSR